MPTLVLTLALCASEPQLTILVGDDAHSTTVRVALTCDFLRTNVTLTPEQEKLCKSLRYRRDATGFSFTLVPEWETNLPYNDVPQFSFGSGVWHPFPESACRGTDAVLRYIQHLADEERWSRQRNYSWWAPLPEPVFRWQQFTDHLQEMQDERQRRAGRHKQRILDRLYPLGFRQEYRGDEWLWVCNWTEETIGKERPTVELDLPSYRSLAGFPGRPEEPKWEGDNAN